MPKYFESNIDTPGFGDTDGEDGEFHLRPHIFFCIENMAPWTRDLRNILNIKYLLRPEIGLRYEPGHSNIIYWLIFGWKLN